jgi:hypothetical protein
MVMMRRMSPPYVPGDRGQGRIKEDKVHIEEENACDFTEMFICLSLFLSEENVGCGEKVGEKRLCIVGEERYRLCAVRGVAGYGEG